MRILIVFYFLFFSVFLPAQTSLSVGDIAFISFNLDGSDDFTFILLKDIDASTNINFTDCGWSDGSNTFVCNAGDSNAWVWTSGAMLNLGQTVTITVPTLSASIGTVSGSAGVMSNLGDQIFAYQGTAAVPQFISGVHSDQSPTSANDANWSGNVTNNQTSALPDDLTTGLNAIRLHNGGAESDNWQYNCAVVSGDVGTVRTAINNIANWNNDNLSGYSPADPNCTWSISPLPVELMSFHVKLGTAQEVQINWRTASELNNDYFLIEKSRDTKNWEVIKNVQGAGTSLIENNYQVFDDAPFQGLSYYRLQQIDFDGSSSYSPIASILFKGSNSHLLNVYPNPTNGMITLEGTTAELEQLIVLNVFGQDVSHLIVIQNVDSHSITLNFANLTKGIYSLISKSNTYKVIYK